MVHSRVVPKHDMEIIHLDNISGKQTIAKIPKAAQKPQKHTIETVEKNLGKPTKTKQVKHTVEVSP